MKHKVLGVLHVYSCSAQLLHHVHVENSLVENQKCLCCNCTAGCYITQWKLGINHLHAYCGSEEFDIPVIVSIQGKCNDGQWLEEVQSTEAEEYKTMPEQADGYSKLTGQSGGWLTGMLDCGNDRDDRWEAQQRLSKDRIVKSWAITCALMKIVLGLALGLMTQVSRLSSFFPCAESQRNLMSAAKHAT